MKLLSRFIFRYNNILGILSIFSLSINSEHINVLLSFFLQYCFGFHIYVAVITYNVNVSFTIFLKKFILIFYIEYIVLILFILLFCFSHLSSCDYLSSKCVASNIIAGKCDIMLFEFKVFELNVVIFIYPNVLTLMIFNSFDRKLRMRYN